mgnify:CR=1 FL=1
MLTEVRNQLKVTGLSIKYAIMREMLNKATFISNIIFMILNNSCMIVQWIVLFSLKNDMGGYTFRQVLLLWGMAASVYGVSHFFFKKSFHLSDIINSGKLDAYIVQPKNVLISTITSDVQVSALGDILFAILVYFIYGFTIKGFILFLFFSITGGFILTAISVILHSLSFWFHNADMVADVGNNLMVNFATYPDGIFKGITKWLLFTLVPVGIANYIPIKVIIEFNPYLFMINLGVCILLIIIAYIIFYKGLKRYSSSNLMSARI